MSRQRRIRLYSTLSSSDTMSRRCGLSLWFYISYSSILSVNYELTEARLHFSLNINFCLGLTNAQFNELIGYLGWCGRWESNPHGIATEGFSYHTMLPQPRYRVVVWTFSSPCISVQVRAVKSLHVPLQGFARDCPSRSSPEFDAIHIGVSNLSAQF